MHSHDHCHSHHHGHAHGDVADRSRGRRRVLLATLALAASYMVAEFVGGWLMNSLVLLADAGHMLSDVAGLALSLFAVWIAARPPSRQHSFGYYRAEILAALANGALLVAISLSILWEACRRWNDPPPISGTPLMAIAAGGLIVNIVSLALLHSRRDENLNLRGAWLHVLSDALGSVGAIVAGGLIWGFGWNWADPAASALISLLVIHSAWRLLSESVAVLMESTPRGIDPDEVRDALREVEGVVEVHDLHIWTITSGLDSLSAHVVSDDTQPHAAILRHSRAVLHERFGIDHLTIQIEPVEFEERPSPF